MKTGILKAVAVSLSGIMCFSMGLSSVQSASIANEQPLAGLNLSLDRYVEHVVADEAADAGVSPVEETQVTDDTNSPAKTSLTANQTPPTEVPGGSEDVDKTKENEHVVLNLNYDRLGIAKVDTYLNVRKKPSEDGKIIGKMTKNSGCHIYSIKKGWAKIVSGKVNGYVKAEYLVTDQKAEAMALEVGTHVATVATPALKVRALPSTDSTMYSVIALDEDFEIVKENISKRWIESFIENHKKKKEVKKTNYDEMLNDLSNWVCIRVDDDRAFVAKEYVDISYKLKRADLVSELASDGSSGVSSVRANLVEFSKKFLGNRYVWGGTSLTNGADCSGFTLQVFRQFGYSLPRTSGSQASATRSISSSEAKPGDLFFYSNGSRVNHVAIYIGSGMIIHASNPSSGIKISNAYYRNPTKIGRIIND